jgi:hypothetical protein
LKHGFPQGSILGTLLFIVHINDHLLRINPVSESILFADYTSVIISSRNLEDFCSVTNLVLCYMIKWFAANNLLPNLDIMNIMKFLTKHSSHSTLHTGCKGEYTEKTVNTTVFCLKIDNHINWKNH